MSHSPLVFAGGNSSLVELDHGFPFEIELTLNPLIAYWKQVAESSDSISARLARALQEDVRRAPELLQPVCIREELAQHRDLVEALMSAVFPAVFWEKEYAAALIPFELKTFYATPAFQRDLAAADGHLKGRLSVDKAGISRFRMLNAYSLALAQIHGVQFPVDYPIIISTDDGNTGLPRHLKIVFDGRFIEVEAVGALPPLSADVRARLEAGAADIETLEGLFPAGRLKFRGFTVLRALDVTDQEVLSSLKRDLIDKESIVSQARFEGLQDKLRTLLRQPDLRLGLSAIQGDRVMSLNSGAQHDHACIFADSIHHKLSDLRGSLYERALQAGAPIFIEDLTTHPDRSPIEQLLLDKGIRSLALSPLRYQGAAIGTLSLSSARPGGLTSLQTPRLEDVLPLFSMAVKRSMDEFSNRVQAFIKEKCTAIHPVVEWRFRKAVFDGLERQGQKTGSPAEMDAIVFSDVYPLYAIADIRGSSTQRSGAIQADLLTQLALARDVLRAAHDVRPLPILDHLTHRIDTLTRQIEVSIRTGDEMAILTFLRAEIEVLFDHLQGFGPAVKASVDAYRAAVDPDIGSVYARRCAFDESMTTVTDAISAYIDLEEQAAQAMYPHYFEKQQTDGVDYNVYVGGALLEDGRFDPLYLKNLRLWQLMVACGIAIRTERIKPQLSVPLEVTNLILVHHPPLSIRFRFDEKRFDVDGAYNVRYEIIKKRIDKAVVRGTSERLTQPGKIALVYSHGSEAAEWREYIEYLQTMGYLLLEVEDLELDELQGAQGLRALRVAVDLAHREPADASTAPALIASTRAAS